MKQKKLKANLNGNCETCQYLGICDQNICIIENEELVISKEVFKKNSKMIKEQNQKMICPSCHSLDALDVNYF